MALPNLKQMFIPDPDHIMWEADLKGADAQVVAWEAEDEALKFAFRNGLDVHFQNAKDLFSDPELHAADEKTVKSVKRLKKFRQFAKVGVHATNYGCKEKTLADHLEISVPEAQQFQYTWFSKHPGIYCWQQRTQFQLETNRTITNRFGYRSQYFDRIDSLLPEALAWGPQSTIAICVNKGWVSLAKSGLPIQVLLQVHDSLVGQIHRRHYENDPTIFQQIAAAMSVTIPYEDPLIIPVSIAWSDKSWGDIKEV